MPDLTPADLHVWEDSDCVWVVAADARDAAIAYAEFCGYDDPAGQIGLPGTYINPDDWGMVPDDSELEIDRGDEGIDLETQTCAQWVAEQGRGFLCTTER
jgi:hypothetical protein